LIEVDGSSGEGGGQILRTSLALAAALGQDVRIFNIRAGRSEPGIRAQHLTAAVAVGKVSNASIEGLKVGSEELVFRPGKMRGGQFAFDVGTAGSVTLVLQALMPLLPFAPAVHLELKGGTDVKWSPPIDYLRMVTLPILSEIGPRFSLRTTRRGHYPKGGGAITFDSQPSGSLTPINGSRIDPVDEILGVSHASNLPRHVAERQAESASQAILAAGLLPPKISIEVAEGLPPMSPGSGIVLAARRGERRILGGDSLGDRGRPAERVGQEAGRILVEEVQSGALLDKHMGDMIVPYIALADGVSEVSVSQVTQHTLTNVRVAESIAGVRFEPTGELGRPGRLRVRGVGLSATHVVVSARETTP
jgi:RNA 3'-terminal phosphate cyclase (ATP)